jgi:cytochrome subunit of sulfide dehydrogenase
MKINPHKFSAWPLLILLATVSMYSCKKDLLAEETKTTSSKSSGITKMAAATVSTELQARALAANCFQCHGTNGYASELKIAGINGEALLSKFSEMRARGARDNIMNVHAFAYTTAEVQMIGDYFSKQ